MALDEQPSLFFLGLFQGIARFRRLGAAGIEIFELSDAGTVGALATEIGKASRRFKTVHGAGDHGRERVLSRTSRAGEDDRMRKAVTREHLANL